MIAMACDHGGHELKKEIISYLEKEEMIQEFEKIIVCGAGTGISVPAPLFV